MEMLFFVIPGLQQSPKVAILSETVKKKDNYTTIIFYSYQILLK